MGDPTWEIARRDHYIKSLQARIAVLEAENARLRVENRGFVGYSTVKALEARITELETRLREIQNSYQQKTLEYDARIAELNAENTRIENQEAE